MQAPEEAEEVAELRAAALENCSIDLEHRLGAVGAPLPRPLLAATRLMTAQEAELRRVLQDPRAVQACWVASPLPRGQGGVC